MISRYSTVKIELKRPQFEIADLRRAAIVTRISVKELVEIFSRQEKLETREYIIRLIKE